MERKDEHFWRIHCELDPAEQDDTRPHETRLPSALLILAILALQGLLVLPAPHLTAWGMAVVTQWSPERGLTGLLPSC